MQLHRLAWTIGATSLLLLGAYACGGDDDDTNNDTPDSGGTPDTGSVDRPDTGTDTPDTGSPTDAGDAGIDSGLGLLCTGNPLSPDGGINTTNQDGGVFTIATGEFPYGPQYIDENGGQLIFSESDNHIVVSTGPDGGTGKTNVLTDTNQNYGQTDYAAGFLYTVSQTTAGGGILFKTPADGGAATSIATWSRTQLNGPNGIAVGKNGIGYITDPSFLVNPVGDPPGTGVYSVRIADGGLTNIENRVDRPVGIALNADQTRLYVSYQGKQLKYWTIDPATGAASGVTSFQLTPRFNPGGIAVDQGGNVWVAEYDGDSGQRGVIEVFNASGTRLWATVFIPGRRPNGIAFGGADRTKVFVTTDSADGTSDVYSFSTRCPGTL